MNSDRRRILILIVLFRTASKSKRKKKAEDYIYFKRFRTDGKDMVSCELCTKNPATVKMHIRNQRLPKIATENGTGYRVDVVEGHLDSDYHEACLNVERINSLKVPDKILTPMDFSISKANSKQADYNGKLHIQVFYDAKCLFLTARSWPGRFVACESSNAFQFNKIDESIIPANLSLQYINPKKHHEIMKSIVDADRKNLKSKIIDCLALSLRIDGSVDRSQMDKIYVCGKLITKEGKQELVFLGMDEQTERGAIGLFRTTLNAMIKMFSKEFVYAHILPKISSVCTDGVNTNTGERGGLWFHLEKEISSTNSKIPLIKIWCVAHRGNLTFGDLCKNNAIVADIISNMSKVSSYFHTSGLRTAELKAIASEKVKGF